MPIFSTKRYPFVDHARALLIVGDKAPTCDRTCDSDDVKVRHFTHGPMFVTSYRIGLYLNSFVDKRSHSFSEMSLDLKAMCSYAGIQLFDDYEGRLLALLRGTQAL